MRDVVGSAPGWLIAAGFAIYTTTEILSYFVPFWIIFVSVLGTLLLGLGINLAFVGAKEGEENKAMRIAANVAFGAAFVAGSIAHQDLMNPNPSIGDLRFLIVGSTIQMTLFATSGALALWPRGGGGVRGFAVLGVAGQIAYGASLLVILRRIAAGTFDAADLASMPFTAGFIALMILPGLGYALTVGTGSGHAMAAYQEARQSHATTRGLPPTAIMVHPPREP